MSKLHINTFCNEVTDRLGELLTAMTGILKERGIIHICDEQTGEVDLYCQPFMYDYQVLRIRELCLKGDNKPVLDIHLEDGDYRSVTWIPLDPVPARPGIAETSIRMALLKWVDAVLDALDKNLLMVKDGKVTLREYKPGEKVRWIPSNIDNYPPKRALTLRSRIYKLLKIHGDTVTLDDGGIEKDVPLRELVPYVPIVFDKPRECEMYTIHVNEAGVRHIHIFAYFWAHCEGGWRMTEATWLDEPLEAFVREYKDDPDGYMDLLWQSVKQTEKDCTKEEATKLMNTYFDGTGPEKNLQYGKITEDTPCGNYVHYIPE